MTGPAPQGASSFWRFSLDFYGAPGVAPAFLTLQEDTGADVNLLLFLFFLAAAKRAIAAADIARLDAAIAAWRSEIVVPLRAVRRRLKTDTGAIAAPRAELLRQSVKRLELEAERLEQEALEQQDALSAARLCASEIAAAEANLAAYAECFGALPEAPVRVLLAGFEARFA
jgi:uncharacterized protein (TIGR02444 family)